MDGRLLLVSSNKTSHYFKEWATAGGVLKKTYCLYKNLIFPIDSASSSWSQKLKAVITLKQQLFGESQKSPLQVQMFTIALLKNLPYWITAIAAVKLSNWDINHMKEWDSYKYFCVFNTVTFLQKLLELVLWNK